MINMKKEYRAELKLLRKARKKVWRDARAQVLECIRERERVNKDTARRVSRGEINAQRACMKMDRRIAVLEGRLS